VLAPPQPWYVSAVRPVLEHITSEIESRDSELDEETQEEILAGGVDVFLDELASCHDDVIQEEQRGRDRMENSIRQQWGHALNLLDFFIQVNEQCIRLVQTMGDIDESEEEYLPDALIRLHTRGLRVSRGVAALLRAGFAEAGLARWRTLHEIAAVSNLISEKGEEAAERYLEFSAAKKLFQAKNNFQDHLEDLGFEEIPDETIEKLEETTEELTEEYGEDFDDYNGWAEEFVDYKGGSLTITDLIKAGGLENYLPFYALASDGIHAGPKSVEYQIGLHEADMRGEEEVLSAGRSSIGFTDPAQLVALLLQEVTVSLHVLVDEEEWGTYWEVYLRTVNQLTDEVADAFWLVDQLLSAFREAGFKPRVT
jgi:hypothetical protein